MRPRGENYALWLDLIRDVLGLVGSPALKSENIFLVLPVLVLIGVLFLLRNGQGLGSEGKDSRPSQKKTGRGSSKSRPGGKNSKKPGSGETKLGSGGKNPKKLGSGGKNPKKPGSGGKNPKKPGSGGKNPK